MNRYLAFTLMASVALIVGCGSGGPKLGKVTGTVTLDEKPMPKLMVTFVPKAGGQTSTAVTNSQGKYELLGANTKGAELGLHVVKITTVFEASTTTTNTQMSSDSPEYANQGDISQYKKAVVQKELVPARYNTASELVEEVVSGSNTIDFELTSK